jgi:hypothetical protein
MIGRIFVLAALAAAAPAGSTQPASYECDAPRGYYETINLSGSESRVRVSGTLVVVERAERIDRYLSLAGVMFVSDDGKQGTGLQIWQSPRGNVQYGFRRVGTSNPRTLGEFPNDSRFEIALSLDGEGNVELRVNNRTHHYEGVKVPPRNPVLVCSGGRFRFENLVTTTDA